MIGSGMMKDSFAKAYNKLVQRYNKQGYLSEDDFIAITEKLDIPLIRLSELQERLYDDGIEITELSAVLLSKKTRKATKESSPPKISETTKKSLIRERTDKYEIIFSELETIDPQKVKELFFDDFDKARIQSTYIPILLLAFLENTNKNGIVILEKIVTYYQKFYSERKIKNQIVERSDSIFVKSEPTDNEIRRLILFNPLGRSFLKKYFRYDKQTDTVCINKQLWMGMSFADGLSIKEISIKLIDEYYKKLSDNCLADNKSAPMPYWHSNCSFPYSKMMLLFSFGYYYEGIPFFDIRNCSIEINENKINEIDIAEDLYDKLESVDDITLSPLLVFQHKETNMCLCGVQSYIMEPLNGKAYDPIHAKMVNAPFVECSPLVFECRITDRKKEVNSYYTSTKISVEIINVVAYSSIVSNGEVDIERLFELRGLYTSNH